MSAPKLFQNASHFTIQGSEFNAVAGDIVTNNFHGPTTTSISGKTFRVLPCGDVFIIQHVHEKKLDSVKAVRSINTVQVVGLGESRKFTAVIYKGPQARQAFQDDLGRYSRTWHPNVAQLFGVIQSDIPAMIFHSELIPITYFANQYASNPFAQAYLRHRYTVDWLEAFMTSPLPIMVNQLWIQPTSGLICCGPDGPLLTKSWDFETFFWGTKDAEDICVPPLQDYTSNTAILQHIEKHYGTMESFVGTYIWSEAHLLCSGIPVSFTFGSVIHVHETFDVTKTFKTPEPIAQVLLESGLSYTISRWRDQWDELKDCNGWSRAELSRIPGMYFRYQFFVEIEIPTRNNLAAAGLVQCHHLCQDKSDFVFLGSKIRMVLHASNIWRKLPIHLTDCNVYLFIAPVKVAQFLDTPQFAFAEQPYFWSLDPSGSLKLNEETQKLLGLPSFDTLVVGERWDPIGLSAVRKYMELKKLDPLEYSRAQNYPIFKLSGHICDDDDLEIIDAASEGISSDTLDDKDAWELISKETQADSLHATDDEETIFLPWSQHCPERHPHTYSCSFGLNYTRPKLRELRHSRSCSSLIVNGTIHEPLGDRIHNALYASSQPRQYNIEQNVWQSIEYKNLIPHEHIDYCLNLIDY